MKALAIALGLLAAAVLGARLWTHEANKDLMEDLDGGAR